MPWPTKSKTKNTVKNNSMLEVRHCNDKPLAYRFPAAIPAFFPGSACALKAVTAIICIGVILPPWNSPAAGRKETIIKSRLYRFSGNRQYARY